MANFSSKIQQSTAKRQSRSFFKEITIFSCVKAFPGGRAFLQNANKFWWSQRNYVFKCFCVFSCAHLGFRYLLKVYLCQKKQNTHVHPKMIDTVQNQGFHIIRTCQGLGPLFIFVPLWHLAIIAAFQWHLHLSDSQHLLYWLIAEIISVDSIKVFFGGNFRCAERL